jgi:hypothetical protein
VATKLIDGTSTSSPSPMSNASRPSCRAAVAELTATASSAPWSAANAISNRRTRSPIVSHLSSITSQRARFSASPNVGAPSSISGID